MKCFLVNKLNKKTEMYLISLVDRHLLCHVKDRDVVWFSSIRINIFKVQYDMLGFHETYHACTNMLPFFPLEFSRIFAIHGEKRKSVFSGSVFQSSRLQQSIICVLICHLNARYAVTNCITTSCRY